MKASILILAAVLGGCAAVGPDYERPAVRLPVQFPGTASGSTTLDASWWTLYGSAELTRLVEQALAANADIAQAAARVEQADAVLRETTGARLPTVDASSSASRSKRSALTRGSNGGGTGNDYALSLSTAFEIDFWGRLRRADEAARAQLLASQAGRDTVRLSVAALVAQAWFALRSLDEQVAATALTLKGRDESVRLLGLRLEAGTVSRLDVEQVGILRADTALQLRDLQRQRALAQSQLGLLTGDAGLALPDGPLPAVALPVPPAGLPSALLERRPDIRQAEQLLVSANAQIGVARAAMFPTLSLTGALGGQSIELSRLLESPARFWNLGLGLTLPIFDGGRLAARTDQAGARQREAVASYQGAVSAAFRDVADALAGLDAARGSAPDLALRVAAAERAQALAQARFDAGYAGSLELLEAQRTAIAAQLDVVRNRQAQQAASVQLIQALGGGWGG